MFTGADVGFSPVFRGIRGKVAIYNENLRAIAQKHDCVVADLWALTEIQDQRMWAPDRLHLNPLGHHTVARMVLEALNVENDLEPHEARAAARWHVAAGARRRPRLGARVPRAVGAPPHPPPVVRRLRHREAAGCRALPRARTDPLLGLAVSSADAGGPVERARVRAGATTCPGSSTVPSSTSGTSMSLRARGDDRRADRRRRRRRG